MSFYTYVDLAREFGLAVATLRHRMAQWEAEADPFPAPLPWSRRDKRWNPSAVQAWKRRRELHAKAVQPEPLRVAS